MSISKKLGAIQTQLKAPKGQYNSFGKYKYRSCEDILEAVKPLLSKNDCFLKLSDEIVLVGERFYIKATATLQDEEGCISTTAYAREEKEKKGMDGSQITGTASSYARKYALNGLFCIDDTKDADTDEHTTQTRSNTPKTANKAQVTTLYTCSICGSNIVDSDGATAEQIAKATAGKYGKPICKHCIDVKKQNEAKAEELKMKADEVQLPFDII